MDDFHVLGLLQLGGDENVDAERRRNGAHAQVHQDDAGHLHLVDAVGVRNRGQQRHEQEDGGVAVDEHAADDEQNVDDQQEHDGGFDVLSDQSHQLLGDAGEGQGLAGNVGECHDQQDYAAQADGEKHHVLQISGDAVLIDSLVDKIVDQTVQSGDCAGFGSGEDAAVDATEDDNRHQQRPEGVLRGAADVLHILAHHEGFSDLGFHLDAVEVVYDAEQAGQDDAGHQSAHPCIGNADAGGGGIDDAGHAGGNQNTQEAGGGHQSRLVGGLIAPLVHLGEHDLADGGNGGLGGACQGAEQRAGEDGHGAGAGAHTANEGVNEVEDALGDAGVLHNCAGKQEEWDRQQGEVVQTVESGLGEAVHGVAEHREDHCAAQADAESNRKTEEKGEAEENN